MVGVIYHLLGHATIDADVFASDESRLRRAEEQYHVGDVERVAHSADRVLGGIGTCVGGERCVDPSREMELTRALPRRLTARAWVRAAIPPLAAV